MNWRHYTGQALFYLALMAPIGYCTNAPDYQHLPGDGAVIKLSLRHAGQILGECRQRSEEELAELPPNMRIARVCPRERSPLRVELYLDKTPLYQQRIEPGGLSGDGMASLYQRFTVPAGRHTVTVKMKDHIESETFPYQHRAEVDLKPEEVLAIDFKNDKGEFVFY